VERGSCWTWAGRSIAGHDDEVPLPSISGLDGNDPSLLGLVVSHPHQDHYGLAKPGVAQGSGVHREAASRILHEAAFFGCAGLTCAQAGLLRHKQPFDLGPFRITPFLVDHSGVRFVRAADRGRRRRLF